MPVDIIDQVRRLDSNVIEPIVREVVGDESASPEPQWTAEPIGGSIGPGTLGIFRLSGEAKTDTGVCSWSVITKVMDLGGTSEAVTSSSPTREVRAYESGLLATLTPTMPSERSFRAAKHYGTSEVEGLGTILWVEDLSSAPPPPWDDATYVEMARQLGHFNAHWELNKPDRQDWFLNDGFSARIGPRVNLYSSMGDFTNVAIVQRAAPPDVVENMALLAEMMPSVFMALNEGPCPLSHVDAQPRNLFPMPLESGGFETVAIDWATLGYAPMGTDPAQLVGSSLTWCEIEVERGAHLHEQVFDGYLTGLTEMGWSGNIDLARLAYMTAAINRAAGNLSFNFGREGDRGWTERITGLMGFPVDALADQWREVFRATYPMFDDALRSSRVNL